MYSELQQEVSWHCELPGERGPPSLARLPERVRELGQLLFFLWRCLSTFSMLLLFQRKVRWR